MRYLRQNTAVKITVGPFLDHADGVTEVTAMTEASLDGIICYDADDGDAVTTVHFHPSHHDAAGDNDMLFLGYCGMWEIELTAAQTNYTGRMILAFNDPDVICPVWHEFQVLSANVYDSLFTGHGQTADLLDINTAQWLGTACHAAGTAGVPIVEVHDAQTVPANVTQWEGHAVHAHITEGLPVVDVHTIQADAIDAASLKADAVTKIIDNFETQSQADPTGFQVNVKEINGAAQTATLDTIKAETVLIVADTGELQTDWANGGRLDLLLDKATEGQDAHTDTTELLTRIPDATAGANGGLTICGSNAAATFATLSVTGQADAGNVLVDGTTVLTGNVTHSGTTTYTGAVTHKEDELYEKKLTITGATAFTGEVTAPAGINATLATVTALTGKTGFSLASTGADLILKNSTFALAIADAVWEETVRTLSANTNLANLEVDLTKIHGTAITETAGQIAAAFTKLFDVATPVLTCESVNQAQDNPTTAEIKTALEAAGSHLALIKAQTDLMPVGIKKNTQLANFEFFMVLAADHITGATGKAITATRSIDGGAFGACTNAVTEVASGIYKITLAAADLNGDIVTLKFSEATCDTRFITIKTSA